MEINSLTAINNAKSGLDKGADKMLQHSQSINQNLIDYSNAVSDNPPSPDYNALEKLTATTTDSLEDSLVNMHMTKTQMLSLIKVLEVDKELFDDTLGRIFDAKV